MQVVVTLDVSEVLEPSTDNEIKEEINNLIRDAHYYSLIKGHSVRVIR